MSTSCAGILPAPSITNTFAYDCRAVHSSLGESQTTLSIFADGLSIQKCNVPQASSLPCSTKYIRGEGIGGGVSGMVCSMK